MISFEPAERRQHEACQIGHVIQQKSKTMGRSGYKLSGDHFNPIFYLIACRSMEESAEQSASVAEKSEPPHASDTPVSPASAAGAARPFTAATRATSSGKAPSTRRAARPTRSQIATQQTIASRREREEWDRTRGAEAVCFFGTNSCVCSHRRQLRSNTLDGLRQRFRCQLMRHLHGTMSPWKW